jgi:aldose 1-epimerase
VGRLDDGRAVHEVALAHDGMTLAVLTLGVTIVGWCVPDRAGAVADVVLGFDRWQDYLGPQPYLGATVGRYGNRIAGGSFEIDGHRWQVTRNEGTNCLHGGRHGFNQRLWEVASTRSASETEGPAITLRYVSEDGEEGFPGRLEARTTLALARGHRLDVDMEARSDRPTVVNLIRHDYFNLAGSGSVLDHELTLPAGWFHPLDEALIPTATAEVGGTPFDFRRPRVLGERIRDPHPQMVRGRGYDHHWILDETPGHSARLAACLVDPASGRRLILRTTEPGVQVYTSNYLDGTLRGRGGVPLERHAAVCMETQHSPDSPHHPEWPSVVLRPGDVRRSHTSYEFGVAPAAAAG